MELTNIGTFGRVSYSHVSQSCPGAAVLMLLKVLRTSYALSGMENDGMDGKGPRIT